MSEEVFIDNIPAQDYGTPYSRSFYSKNYNLKFGETINMSEEEELENLKHIVEHWKPDDENDEFANIEYNSIKVAVNLIDKLQKENEELKEEIEIHKETENDLEHEILRDEEEIEHKQKTIDKIIKELEEFYEKYDVISKEKIRTKIKELEDAKEKEEYIDEYGVRNIPVLNGLINLKIEVLKELLGDE